MAPTRRIRVYLADDHPLFLDGMARAVRGRDGLELVGTAQNGLDALDGLRREDPDVAVVDLRMRALDGGALVARATGDRLRTRILVLSAYVDDDVVYDTLTLGAAGYLTKDLDRDEILEAVVTAASGRVVMAPDVQAALVREMRRREIANRARLSGRELEILALAADGRSTPEIGDALNLSAA